MYYMGESGSLLDISPILTSTDFWIKWGIAFRVCLNSVDDSTGRFIFMTVL